MKHFGDITKIDGHNVPLVDIVTGGSPCQDLSVAGKRAGLEGERSGLFMEQIRIVKEMRDECSKQLQLRGADVDIRLLKPRFMVWENVPGAFSSNHGEDFRCVLEEICRIADKTANVPISRGGKWSTSGCIMGDWWSVAWRLHDAQFWGVPQRRKRIALVADFGGKSAPKILFERESMSGDIEQSKQARQETSGDTRESTHQSAYTLKIRGGAEIDSYGKRAGKGALIQTEKSGTLGVSQDQTLITVGDCYSIDEKMGQTYIHKDQGNTLGARDYKQPQAVVYGTYQDKVGTLSPGAHAGSYNGQDAYNDMLIIGGGGTEPTTASKASFFLKGRSDGKSDTLVATDYKDPQIVAYENKSSGNNKTIVIEGNDQRESHKGDGYKEADIMYTLNTIEQHAVCAYKKSETSLEAENIPCIAIDRAAFNQGKNAKYDFSVQEEIAQPLLAKGPGGVLTQLEHCVQETTKE